VNVNVNVEGIIRKKAVYSPPEANFEARGNERLTTREREFFTEAKRKIDEFFFPKNLQHF